MTNETKVDPLSVIEQAFTFCAGQNSGPSQEDMRQARAAVAELIEAVRQEHGGVNHHPECPICAALARIGGAA